MKPAFKSLLVLLLLPTAACAETPCEQVARQFREYCLHESTDHGARLLDDVELPKTSPEEAAKLVASLKADGSWPDIDYASQARSSWPPATHLTCVLGLTVYARRAGTPAADATSALAAVHTALAFWKQHDYQCPNWWYNQIGVPKMLGNTAILLNADLAPAERDYITATVLPRAKVGSMTGQNKVWLAANGLMCAALLNDEPALRQAATVIQSELTSGTGEGIQPDFSFHQHGPQQQFGNYGMAYAVEMSRWATVLRGTPFAFAPDKLAILSNFLTQGENWATYRSSMDISACGRQLFPNSPVSKAGVIAGVMRAMVLADAHHANDYQAFVTRNTIGAPNDLVGTRYFWRSDYLLHRRPDLMFSLKMSSTRVIGGETVNSENLSGLHLADGATFLYRTGQEYSDIFPVWNWRQIPGTTAAQGAASLTWPATPDLKQNTDFVGAVTDGTTACAAMDLHRADLHAKKAWFFCGDTLICLGTDITSTGPDPVVTSFNQCLLKTNITVQSTGAKQTIRKDTSFHNLTNPQWIEHDGLRYTLLQNTAVQLTTGPRIGNWKSVFTTPATPKADVSKDVFSLTVSHGSRPTAATYAYAIGPASASQPIEVISNSAQVQAVSINSSQFLAAVFWSAGTMTSDGTRYQVDAPCLVLQTAGHTFVSDPTQKLKSIHVQIDGKSATVTLPQGGEAGKSIEVKLN